MISITPHNYQKFPEFKVLSDVIWQALQESGSTIPDMGKSTSSGIREQIRFKDSNVWHRKPEIDKYVEAHTALKFSDYKPGKDSNELYKAIATEISLLRNNGYIVDWAGSKSRQGIWRLNTEKIKKLTKTKAKQEMKKKNFRANQAKSTIFVRTKQHEFRKILLKQYHKKCLFCGFPREEYVIAAHIVPYNIMRFTHPEDAMNPIDGLLLCRLCDTAFEHGSVILEPDYEISISSELEKADNKSLKSWIGNINQKMNVDNVEYRPSKKYIKEKKLLVCKS